MVVVPVRDNYEELGPGRLQMERSTKFEDYLTRKHSSKIRPFAN